MKLTARGQTKLCPCGHKQKNKGLQKKSKEVTVNDIENPRVTYLSDKALKDYVAVNVKFVKTKSSQGSDETVIIDDEDNNYTE